MTGYNDAGSISGVMSMVQFFLSGAGSYATVGKKSLLLLKPKRQKCKKKSTP
jgi:hypothetical protein